MWKTSNMLAKNKERNLEISLFSKVAVHKISIQNPAALVFTNSELCEIEF
jgi:hypothetical protein